MKTTDRESVDRRWDDELPGGTEPRGGSVCGVLVGDVVHVVRVDVEVLVVILEA